MTVTSEPQQQALQQGSSDLTGRRVLVTRPERQLNELCAALEALGARTIPLPLLRIAPPLAEEGVLRRRLLELDQYDMLVFISSNAVRAGVVAIEDYWPQFPVGIEVLAIGPSTAVLAQEMLHCDVHTLPGGVTSEDLLLLASLEEVEGKRIGIFRGEGGRDLLANELRGRGARVDYFEVYRREEIQYSEKELSEALVAGKPNVLLATSGESLVALKHLIQQLLSAEIDSSADTSNRSALFDLPLIVPSPRVRDLANKSGFTSVINADGADTAAICRAIASLS